MKKKFIIVSVFVVMIFALSIGIYWYYHPTHYKFNDRFILGSTEQQIIEKYGEFSKENRNDDGEITYGTYMIRDNTPELIMGYDNSLWYEIYFENEVATKVRLRKGWYGG